MERLAKEKIAAQNRILFLKRELAQWDIDFTKLLPEQTDISAVKLERTGLDVAWTITWRWVINNFVCLIRTHERCVWKEQSHVQFNKFSLEHHNNIASLF